MNAVPGWSAEDAATYALTLARIIEPGETPSPETVKFALQAWGRVATLNELVSVLRYTFGQNAPMEHDEELTLP